MANNEVHLVTVNFTASSLAKDGELTSSIIQLNDYKPQGFFSAQLVTAGAGIVSLVYSLSDTRGGTYVTPTGASDIVSAHTAGTGKFAFSPMAALFMKIMITEAGVATITSFGLTLAIS